MKAGARSPVAEVGLDFSGVVQFVQEQPDPLVIPKPALSARNLLAAGSETADSSRDKAALRNDNSGVFRLRHSGVLLEQESRSGN